MSNDPVLTMVRFVDLAVMSTGFLLLGREQRVTVERGLPARPRFVVLWVATVLSGLAVQVLAILAR